MKRIAEVDKMWLEAVCRALRRLGNLRGLMAPDVATLRNSSLVRRRSAGGGEGAAALALRDVIRDSISRMARIEGRGGREGRLLSAGRLRAPTPAQASKRAVRQTASHRLRSEAGRLATLSPHVLVRPQRGPRSGRQAAANPVDGSTGKTCGFTYAPSGRTC